MIDRGRATWRTHCSWPLFCSCKFCKGVSKWYTYGNNHQSRINKRNTFCHLEQTQAVLSQSFCCLWASSRPSANRQPTIIHLGQLPTTRMLSSFTEGNYVQAQKTQLHPCNSHRLNRLNSVPVWQLWLSRVAGSIVTLPFWSLLWIYSSSWLHRETEWIKISLENKQKCLKLNFFRPLCTGLILVWIFLTLFPSNWRCF